MEVYRAREKIIIYGINFSHSAKGVNDVLVQFGWQEMRLLNYDNKTLTACVILTLDQENTIGKNIEIIESVKRIIKLINGIMDENIYIINQDGLTLNDFKNIYNSIN